MRTEDCLWFKRMQGPRYDLSGRRRGGLGRELSDSTASVLLWHTRLRLISASLLYLGFVTCRMKRGQPSSNFLLNGISFPHHPNARSAVSEAWEDVHAAHAYKLVHGVFGFTYSATVRCQSCSRKIISVAQQMRRVLLSTVQSTCSNVMHDQTRGQKLCWLLNICDFKNAILRHWNFRPKRLDRLVFLLH